MTDVSSAEATVAAEEPLYEPFKLPITYGSAQQPGPDRAGSAHHCRPLSATLVQDLELVQGSKPHTLSMYERLFQPSHVFGRQLIPEWGKQFSTDPTYLRDTQRVLIAVPEYQRRMQAAPPAPCCERFLDIWEGIHRPDFLEKYSYMEWSMLKSLNDSPTFLQILSVGNLLSPVFSLFIPILFLILPFILLKIQGTEVTLGHYVSALKNIAKNHFIGKALAGLESMSWDKLIYVLLMLGLYLMQIYQNVLACYHFYHNTRQMNQDLVDLRAFCAYSACSMDTFVALHGDRAGYRDFCRDVSRNAVGLRSLGKRLEGISAFGLRTGKMAELGTMMSAYYHIHANGEALRCLRYAVGFEGYMDNLKGVARRLTAGHVSLGKVAGGGKGKRTRFTHQYYPALLDSAAGGIVRNHVSLKKNMVITGPNASGKNTFLKTTAINVVLTQQLGCGYYGKGSRLPRLYTHIHSYLNIPDTSERDSLFQAEARRCKDILDLVEQESDGVHFSIFDELYSGTNPHEATKAAYAFLKYLAGRPHVDFILTTHYMEVCRKVKTTCPRIQNYQMMVMLPETGAEAEPPNRQMKYTYRIQRGISSVEGAGKILEDLDYPSEIMDDFQGV